MKVKWTEEHELEINPKLFFEIADDVAYYDCDGEDRDTIYELMPDYVYERMRMHIEDNLSDGIYEIDRTNIYKSIPNWEQIIDKLTQEAMKTVFHAEGKQLSMFEG